MAATRHPYFASSSSLTYTAVALFTLTLLSTQCYSASAQPTTPKPTTPTPTNTTSIPAPPEERFSMIVVFKEFKTLLKLKTMCIINPIIYHLSATQIGLPRECHMPCICRHVYSNTIFGFAGEFNQSELQTLQRCLPQAVWYRELDGSVHKAEDSSYWHPDQGKGGSSSGDRRRRGLKGGEGSGVVDVHVVNQFDDPSSGGSDAGQGPPIDINAVANGGSISSTGEKYQSLDPKLWNLDRVHQRSLPLDKKYIYGSTNNTGTGQGVTIYVIDSGIKPSHQEFQSADGSGTSRASYGYDFVDDDDNAEDCDGHGTHVAGTAIGLQVGVAKRAKVVSVRILDCDGSGSISDTVAGLDWVAQNANKPAVAILSLGIQVGGWSRVLEDAVRGLVQKYGITVVVASGNSGVDACYVAPANVPETITVAATDVDSDGGGGGSTSSSEGMYQWSNTGPCVDLFAPGVDVYSACGSPSRCDTVTDESYTYASGTSMAVPMVAGVAALYLEAHPNASPSEVAAALTNNATPGLVDGSNFKPGTANRMLYSKFEGGGTVKASGGPPSG